MKCGWCMEVMNDSALVCPACSRERKDFYNLKIATYSFYGLAIGAIAFGISSGSWESAILGDIEVKRVINSISGIAAIVSFVVGTVTYIKASKIANTWWWY